MRMMFLYQSSRVKNTQVSNNKYRGVRIHNYRECAKGFGPIRFSFIETIQRVFRKCEESEHLGRDIRPWSYDNQEWRGGGYLGTSP